MAALQRDRDLLAAKVEELEAEVVRLRQQSRRKRGPGAGYILMPPDLIPTRFPEFVDAFDPFPHPLRDGWNGLTMPWGPTNKVNAPFRKDDNTQGQGLAAVVQSNLRAGQRQYLATVHSDLSTGEPAGRSQCRNGGARQAQVAALPDP